MKEQTMSTKNQTKEGDQKSSSTYGEILSAGVFLVGAIWSAFVVSMMIQEFLTNDYLLPPWWWTPKRPW